MRVWDISQEIFSCEVYPGDPAPEGERLMSIADGSPCNLSAFRMCAHNGTHVDAPFHFFDEGKAVDELGAEPFTGMAYVAEARGTITAEDAESILSRTGHRRILIKGRAELSLAAAELFASEGTVLFGTESQTVGPENAPAAVHRALLSKGVVLLEGIRLAAVAQGEYMLCAAPLKLAGFDGAPCRAVLIEP
ncbi:MAG: cyclase family protein [Oscillospiraceae bacterium]|nr:cyclase family protein [Oscillospiraceae bacterium]